MILQARWPSSPQRLERRGVFTRAMKRRNQGSIYEIIKRKQSSRRSRIQQAQAQVQVLHALTGQALPLDGHAFPPKCPFRA